MIEPTDEMVQLIYERIDFWDHGSDGIREGLAAVLALVERDRPDPIEALRAAYWKLRGHASGYRSTSVFRRRQECFRADPDNAVFARGAARDEWFARGIEAAAVDFAELLEQEYDAEVDPTDLGPAP